MNKAVGPDFDIDAWYQQPPGKNILSVEQQQFLMLPKQVFGAAILQLGALQQNLWLNPYKAPFYLTVSAMQPTASANSPASVRANYTALPFPENFFGTVILPHTLEFAADPKTLVQEAWSVLAPEGHLIILGFNSCSLNYLCYACDKTGLDLPATAKFHSAHKIYQWLKNTHYEIICARHFHYLPFTRRQTPLKNLQLLEKMAAWLFPHFGGIYLLVLKKRVVPLIPLRLRWHWRELFNSKDLHEPAAGNIHRE